MTLACRIHPRPRGPTGFLPLRVRNPTASSLSWRIASLPTRAPTTTMSQRQIWLTTWRRRTDSQHDLPVYFPEEPKATGLLFWRDPKRRKATGRWFLRAGMACTILYLCAMIYVEVVINPLVDWLEEEYDSLPEDEKQEINKESIEDEGVLLFLPFPFTKKLVPSPPYKSSDPEWTTFLKVNRDKEQQKAMKYDLSQVLLKALKRDPRFLGPLGGPDIKVRRAWLDIIYPNRPPPHYIVSGVAIAEDGIFWADQDMDAAVGSRLDRVLQPTATARSAWAFAKTLATETAKDISKYLGFPQQQPPDPSWHATVLKRIERGSTQPNAQGKMPPQSAGKPITNIQLPAKGAGSISVSSGDELGGDHSRRAHLAVIAAANELAKGYKIDELPPKGGIRVDGLVEFAGKRANIAVYVQGWYDPSRRQFVKVKSLVKHILSHEQRAGQS